MVPNSLPPLLRPSLQVIPTANIHRSNAQELVSQVPVIEVEGHVAMCDGGGGATGHPIEYIQLDKRAGELLGQCGWWRVTWDGAEARRGGPMCSSSSR